MPSDPDRPGRACPRFRGTDLRTAGTWSSPASPTSPSRQPEPPTRAERRPYSGLGRGRSTRTNSPRHRSRAGASGLTGLLRGRDQALGSGTSVRTPRTPCTRPRSRTAQSSTHPRPSTGSATRPAGARGENLPVRQEVPSATGTGHDDPGAGGRTAPRPTGSPEATVRTQTPTRRRKSRSRLGSVPGPGSRSTGGSTAFAERVQPATPAERERGTSRGESRFPAVLLPPRRRGS